MEGRSRTISFEGREELSVLKHAKGLKRGKREGPELGSLFREKRRNLYIRKTFHFIQRRLGR